MPQVQLDDQVFKAAQQRATADGYASINEYIADVIVHDLADDGGFQTPNLDHLFTPERLAKIDKARQEINAGHFFTADQAEEELAKRRAEWLGKKPPWMKN